jgi:hypothetical protein
MLATGTIDTINRTFDILGVAETNTSISTINSILKLSYLSEDGKLIQLVKPINTGSDNISIGDFLDISPTLDNNIGGYAQRTNEQGVCKSLTTVDWSNTNNLTTKTFVDSNGITRTAVLLPVVL